MFKTDAKSLEQISFLLQGRDLANLKFVVENLKSFDLLTLTPEETQRVLKGLEDVGKLKLEGTVYAFHVHDSFAAQQGGSGEGVELYLRQGNKLDEFYVSQNRDFVHQVDDAIDFLQSKKIRTIYTGTIPNGSDFLGVPQECDDEDPMTRRELGSGEIYLFQSYDINTITLDSLI